MTQVVTAAELAERSSNPDPNVNASRAVFASEQPSAPAPALLTGKVDGEPADKAAQTERPKSNMERVKAELAAQVAAETKGAPVAAPATTAATPAPVAGELTAEQIAKAESNAAEVAAAKAAIAPAGTEAKETDQELFKKDPLAYLESKGLAIDDVVKQAFGQKPDAKPTREQELEAENTRLKAEGAKFAEVQRRTATVNAIIAEPRFANLKTAENVEAAFAEARRVAAAIEADPDRGGRKLTATEGDKLTEFYLAKHNAKLAPATNTSTSVPEQSLKSGTLKPPVGRRSIAAVKKELAGLIAQGK